MSYNLLENVKNGGCSAKLSPKQLEGILQKLPMPISCPDLLVDMRTCDDAGVFRLNDDMALIFSTDFFPPLCESGYDFGQIAAANALSDIYAMGGTPLLALNLMGFSPSELPAEAYTDILKGGIDKLQEAGAWLVGGHTIDSHPPIYGLAVVGTVHPDKLLTNAGARIGDKLILTKPLGVSVLLAGRRMEMVSQEGYTNALNLMKQLNKTAIEVVHQFDISALTDVTGFGLLGHALNMARECEGMFSFSASLLPLLPEVYQLLENGCIPGAAFRNLEYVKEEAFFEEGVDYNLKMAALDPQTSGGLLLACADHDAEKVIDELSENGIEGSIIGEVKPSENGNNITLTV